MGTKAKTSSMFRESSGPNVAWIPLIYPLETTRNLSIGPEYEAQCKLIYGPVCV